MSSATTPNRQSTISQSNLDQSDLDQSDLDQSAGHSIDNSHIVVPAVDKVEFIEGYSELCHKMSLLVQAKALAEIYPESSRTGSADHILDAIFTAIAAASLDPTLVAFESDMVMYDGKSLIDVCDECIAMNQSTLIAAFSSWYQCSVEIHVNNVRMSTLTSQLECSEKAVNAIWSAVRGANSVCYKADTDRQAVGLPSMAPKKEPVTKPHSQQSRLPKIRADTSQQTSQ